MSIHSFKEFTPSLAEGVFVAASADVIGRVKVHAHASIWFQCVVRGDVNEIEIGADTNIQDLSCLHVTGTHKLTIGRGVTVGHSVNLHACTVEDHCLIGIGSTVLDGAVIGAGSVVAAASLVAPGKVFPPNSLIQGSPAKVVRPLSLEEQEQYHNHYKSYLKIKADYLP